MPTTIEDLIGTLEAEHDSAELRRVRANTKVKTIIDLAGREGRASLSPEETEEVTNQFKLRDQAKDDLKGIDDKLAIARRAQVEEREVRDAQQQTRDTPAAGARPAQDRTVHVGREERTYRPDIDRRGQQFLWDVVRRHLFGEPEASERLARHMAEERVERGAYLTRAVGTGAFTGLVVPQYLTDMYAPAVAALRPFADACNRHDLPPEGMTVNISRITTSTSVGLQASQNVAVSEQNAADTLLTENVQTAAGQQTISRQAIERGIGVDDVLMNDLFRRYATSLDGTLITQATTGLSAVSTAVTYDDTTPTAPELYPKFLGALAGSEAALLAQAIPDLAVMHSRRWYWLNSQMTSSWPFIGQPGVPPQVAGVNQGTGYNQGIRGYLPNGLPVVVDNNIATNLGTATSQDEVYVVPTAECHLWEDPQAPVFIRAEQPAAASLGVLMVLYGYFAYSFRRYANAMQKIAGTGLTTPTF
jgi:hypothetical protein